MMLEGMSEGLRLVNEPGCWSVPTMGRSACIDGDLYLNPYESVVSARLRTFGNKEECTSRVRSLCTS